MNSRPKLLSVAEALTRVTGGFSLISSEQVALGDGLGRVLAEDVAARLTQPPSAVSAMDGYAVRAADVGSVPVTLKQIGVSQAGQGFPGAVGPGECARIFTGAPLPDGADAIVIQEDTTAVNEQITVMESAQSGADVRPAGLDFSVGDILLKTGAVLSARDLGLADDAEQVNPNGGAIALGHPLGCTGSKLTVQLLHELKSRGEKYGCVTMCVGTGQGAAGVFELL